MTREDLIKLADDEEAKEVIYETAEYIAAAMIGTAEAADTCFNSKTQRYEKFTRDVKLMEVLISIKDALWTIANNM